MKNRLFIKKAVAFVLSATVVASTFSGMGLLTNGKSDVTLNNSIKKAIGYIDTVEASDGVEFKIKSLSDFEQVMNTLSGYNSGYTKITLEKDIVLSGINNYKYTPKLGKGVIFDGKGHSISGINSDSVCGLFAENKGTIKNLSIVNSTFYSENNNVWFGSIVGINFGIVSNCHASNVNINLKECVSAGGLVGSSDTGAVRNCTFSGSIVSNQNVGGICGKSYADIENCANFGKIECTSSSHYVGGICGVSKDIRNCYNTGSIIAVKDEYSWIGGVGGIAGSVYDGSAASYVYTNSGVAVGKGTVTNSGSVLTDSYMRSQAFVKVLNDNAGNNQEWLLWELVGGSYPMPVQQESIINVSNTTLNAVYQNQNMGLGFTTTGIKQSDVTVISSKSNVATPNGNGTIKISGPGVTKITLKFEGNDRFKPAASKTVTVKVSPAKVKNVKAISKKKKQIVVTWNKTKCTGYTIQYSTDKKFSKKNTKTITVKNSGVTKKTITGLKGNKKYYVRVIAYYKQGSTKLESSASAVKQVKVRAK